ncbi:MAG: hypothetical protein IT318_24755 [Anaerolineales bacterium]|nr:hypothetical protein [Anaerolineales bacterium]
MAAEYKLIARNASGVKQFHVFDFLWLAYSKRRRRPGLLRFGLPGDHPLVAELADDWQLEVHRRDVALGLGWYKDFEIFFKDQHEEHPLLPGFEGGGPGQLSLLARRIVAWKAATANRSAFTAVAAETIMKTLVQYNATASATTGAGRQFDGTWPDKTITLQADGGGGNVKDWSCAWDPLLDTLEQLARIAGGDYDLVKTGPTTWQFRWYTGQRGSDLTAGANAVTFSTAFGNMVEPTYDLVRSEEATVAIVGGAGEGSGRLIRTRTGADYTASRKSELFVDKRSDSANNVLDAAGDAALDRVRARQQYGFKVRQTPACAYGLHYAAGGVLGDKVNARFRDHVAAQVIDGVNIAYTPEAPTLQTVEVELADA